MSALRPTAGAAIALAGLAIALGTGVGAASAAPLSIAVSGNHFIDRSGNTVRLLGVNRQSTEYACFNGYAYANGTIDKADTDAIAAWHATAVRIPLNEHCWLGLNGRPPTSFDGRPSGLTAVGYRQAIVDYVEALHAHGLYAILDLHWTAPAGMPADGQRSLPDDHSAAFWTSVASTFLGDPAVLFDVFNEPGTWERPVSWDCWRDGGCQVSEVNDGIATAASPTYTAVGMAGMVSAIRATGAKQPIMLGGLAYANDLSGWLAHKPTNDPLGQLVASFHNYPGPGKCDTQACWDTTIAPVAAQVPVVTGEFGEDDCPAAVGAGLRGDNPANFDNTYMAWADAHGVSYTAWAWIVLPNPTCLGLTSLSLISDYSGTPIDPNGVALHSHLASLAASTGGSATPTKPASPTQSPTNHSAPILTGLRLSRSAFRAAPSGPTVQAAATRTGTRVSYKLNVAATVRFTFERAGRGRTVAGRCVKPTNSNHKRPGCARFTPMRGGFIRSRAAGADLFTFTARVAGRALKPGRYRLVATPTANGHADGPTRARFRVVR
jgi:endoglucanase